MRGVSLILSFSHTPSKNKCLWKEVRKPHRELGEWILASGDIGSGTCQKHAEVGKKWKQWQTLFSWPSESLWTVTAAMKFKDACSLERGYDKPIQHIKKQRHHFADKSPSSQSYGFSNSHIHTWALDHEEGWMPKNWCFWIVVLEKTLESPLDYKESNQSILTVINPEYSLEGLLMKLKLHYFGHLM